MEREPKLFCKADFLTPRQKKFVEGKINGLSEKELAAVSGCALQTVKNTLRGAYDKFEERTKERPSHEVAGFLLRKRMLGIIEEQEGGVVDDERT